MTREEHLKWAKERALVYARSGDVNGAIASMASDLRKHPETDHHVAIELGTMMLLAGLLKTREQAVEFIEGFN